MICAGSRPAWFRRIGAVPWSAALVSWLVSAATGFDAPGYGRKAAVPQHRGAAWKFATSASPACASPPSASAATISAAGSTRRRRGGDPQGARPRHHAVRHRRYLRRPRRLGNGDGRDPGRRPQAHRPGHQVRHPDGRFRREVRRVAPLHHAGGGGQPAPAAHRLDRPVPDPPPRPAHADRGDAARPGRPGTPGQGALHRLLQLPRLAGGGGAVDCPGRQPERVRFVPGRILAGGARTWSSRSCGRRCCDTAWACCRSSRSPVAC